MKNPNDYAKQKERALTRKLELIAMRGGKCEICGYDKNIAALDFHHKDPSTKKFQLDSRHLSNTTTEDIIEESKKCILVCSNCHRELHNPQMDKSNIPTLLEEMTSKHSSVEHKKAKHFCEYCGKEMPYTTGKRFCSKECRDAASVEGYPTVEELEVKYREFGTWEKVAEHFGYSRRVIQRLRNKGL